jgi:hypothetical protein
MILASTRREIHILDWSFERIFFPLWQNDSDDDDDGRQGGPLRDMYM